jgi:hypothetical protein
MADKGESMMMGNPSCEWVRDWLPLLAGDGEEISGEDGDLSVEDRRRMERHLGECTSCRQHRAALAGALSILGAIAAEPPVGPDTGSVWPGLEGRIRRHHERERSRWMGALRASCPQGLRVTADRLYRGWGEIRSQFPFQMAWARDSVREFLDARLRVLKPDPVLGRDFPLRGAFPRLAFGLGLAFLALLIIVPLVHRRQSRAEAQIAANAAPIPGANIPPAELQDEPQVASNAPEADPRPADSLAQADPPPAADAPAAGQGQGAAARPSAAASPTPPYYFDLEHGIPMPPDSRGGKPAY